jgi:hypothetical protein
MTSKPTMKTPRTDAAKFRIGDSDHFAVHVTHSEQLERELAAMTDLADRLAEAISQSPYDEPLAEALDAYENHKTQTP